MFIKIPIKIPNPSATKSPQLHPLLGLFLSPDSFPIPSPRANTAPNRLAIKAGVYPKKWLTTKNDKIPMIEVERKHTPKWSM